MNFLIGIVILLSILVVILVFSTLVIAGKADDEIEKQYRSENNTDNKII